MGHLESCEATWPFGFVESASTSCPRDSLDALWTGLLLRKLNHNAP